ncbi:putative helicase [Cotonvirus japonicus]|uniref:Helicase n=1 Tax=Cotonvirus japonicus TaxID=2811091 RepID=A0ABM7NUA3_9VIRU|nr:putative helicase [Cotonvirus japonicus]BCS83768.1 putative helicase [Cotonvirus japonicus]
MSIQDKAAFAAKISILLEYGRKEITTKKQLEKFPIGSIISYLNQQDLYRPGGFITKFADNYFIYVTPDFKTKYRVKYKNVKKMWVGDVYKVKNDVISLSETTQKETNFPVKIGETVIYYASNNFNKTRYMNSKKFKIITTWYDYFIKKDKVDN